MNVAIAENSHKPWTEEEDRRLRSLVASAATLFEIAETLNRTPSSIKSRAYSIRLSLGRFRRGRVRSRYNSHRTEKHKSTTEKETYKRTPQ
jgi:hypothetical protein